MSDDKGNITNKPLPVHDKCVCNYSHILINYFFSCFKATEKPRHSMACVELDTAKNEHWFFVF